VDPFTVVVVGGLIAFGLVFRLLGRYYRDPAWSRSGSPQRASCPNAIAAVRVEDRWLAA
jgi:hypothetical protein